MSAIRKSVNSSGQDPDGTLSVAIPNLGIHCSYLTSAPLNFMPSFWDSKPGQKGVNASLITLAWYRVIFKLTLKNPQAIQSNAYSFKQLSFILYMEKQWSCSIHIIIICSNEKHWSGNPQQH